MKCSDRRRELGTPCSESWSPSPPPCGWPLHCRPHDQRGHGIESFALRRNPRLGRFEWDAATAGSRIETSVSPVNALVSQVVISIVSACMAECSVIAVGIGLPSAPVLRAMSILSSPRPDPHGSPARAETSPGPHPPEATRPERRPATRPAAAAPTRRADSTWEATRSWNGARECSLPPAPRSAASVRSGERPTPVHIHSWGASARISSPSGAKYDRLVVKNLGRRASSPGESSMRAAAAIMSGSPRYSCQVSLRACQRFSRASRKRSTFKPRISMVLLILPASMAACAQAASSAVIVPSKRTCIRDGSAGNILGSTRSGSTGLPWPHRNCGCALPALATVQCLRRCSRFPLCNRPSCWLGQEREPGLAGHGFAE